MSGVPEYRQHNKSNSREYKSWEMMIQRCTNPNFTRYPLYGGRGIKVCNRWLDFRNFYEDMGKRPENTSLDRINVNGNYEPTNCRWASQSEQIFNRGKQQNNKSGVTGVYFHKQTGRWTAAITSKGKVKHLGIFSDIEDAITARKEAELKYFGRYKEG